MIKSRKTKFESKIFKIHKLLINFILFSEKIAKKNQMEQLELRPLNRTDQFVALENLSVKTVTTKISL